MDRDVLKLMAHVDQTRAELRVALEGMDGDALVELFRDCTAGRLACMDEPEHQLVGMLAAMAIYDICQSQSEDDEAAADCEVHDVADALRTVTAKMQQAIGTGVRSKRIDADDLIEVLLAVADELDPPIGERVDPASACPACGERRADQLVWQEDESVRCTTCGATYRPGQ